MRLRTLGPNPCRPSIPWRPRVRRRFTLVSLLLCTACATNRLEGLPVVGNLDMFQDALGGSRLGMCTPLRAAVSVAAEVNRAQVVWDGEEAALVYEATYRDGAKTIWQPLNSRFEAAEAGVILGPEKGSQVTDFRSVTDPRGGIWTSFRVRNRATESQEAVIEHSNRAGKLTRLTVPIADTEMPQRVWVLPLSLRPDARPAETGDFAHVIVRTTTVHDDKQVAMYRWFSFDPAREKIIHNQTYVDKENAFSTLTFFHVEGYADPMAAAVRTGANQLLGKQLQTAQNWSHVVVMRPFAAGQEQLLVHKTKSPLNSLSVAVSPTGAGEIFFSWIREPEGSQLNPTLEWVAAAPTFGKKKSVERTAPITKPLESITLEHSPFGLEFIHFPYTKGAPKNLSVAWWGAVEQDYGLLISRVSPPMRRETVRDRRGQSSQRPTVAAFFSRFRLGTPMGLSVPAWGSGHPLILIYADKGGNEPAERNTQIRFCVLHSKAFEGL